MDSFLYSHHSHAEHWNWPHFKPAEMACHGSGELGIIPEFMDRLERLRASYGKPMPITSGYRSEAHNRAVGGAPNSLHLKGRAVDISVRGRDALELIVLAHGLGFSGIGVNQKGGGRFIHIDDSDGPNRPALWSY